MSERIKYRKGFKYVVAENYRDRITVQPPNNIVTEYGELDTAGRLLIRAGFPTCASDARGRVACTTP